MNIDYNCYVGSWPFVKRRQVDFDGLRAMHEKHDIQTGFVSSLNAVYYNDPFEGDLELAGLIRGSGYCHAVSVNPMLPNTAYDIKRADESFEYDAFRVYPTVHGYDFDSPQFTEFYHMAVHKRKPILIHCSFGDFRLDYLFKQKSFEAASLKQFLSSGLNTPVVLCNMRHGDMVDMKELIADEKSIYLDMSEMRHSMFSLEDMENAGLTDHVVFGAFYPVFDFKAAYMQFDKVEPDIKKVILERNII